MHPSIAYIHESAEALRSEHGPSNEGGQLSAKAMKVLRDSAGMRLLEHRWRDLRTGGTHICNVMDTIYTAWANDEFETGAPAFTFH